MNRPPLELEAAYREVERCRSHLEAGADRGFWIHRLTLYIEHLERATGVMREMLGELTRAPGTPDPKDPAAIRALAPPKETT